MLTILIVDDEKEELEGISFLIDKLGFKLYKVFADNGNQALEYLQNHKVDILFTDIRMPRMDGLELIKLAKNENPNLKIIIYSGYADFAYAQSAINLEVSEYILKPIKVEYKFPNLPYYRGAADQVFFLGRPLGRFGLSSAGFFLGLPRFLGAGLGIGFERPRASSSSNT